MKVVLYKILPKICSLLNDLTINKTISVPVDFYIEFKVTECKQFSYKNISLFNGFGEKIRATVFNSS